MNKKLLLKLADLLDRVPEEKFSMNHWGFCATDGKAFDKPRCATSACALGWATTIPACKLELVSEGRYTPFAEVRSTNAPHYMNIKAAEYTFDLTEEQASHLFLGVQMTSKQKAAQIRRLVRTGLLYRPWP